MNQIKTPADTSRPVLHVYDFPQLYTKPSSQALLNAIDLLTTQPASFSCSSGLNATTPQVDPSGIPRYLTSIISSPLGWIRDLDVRERIWEAASARLSAASGRTAMPSMTRSFAITPDLTITLHEPSLTEDKLGLKTWTSSLLLAKRLSALQYYVPQNCDQILELGAGTGLVGIAAACLWHQNVTLTDLPEIVPNLSQNLELNKELVRKQRGTTGASVLDWSDTSSVPTEVDSKFLIILAADPIYSSDHPQMFVATVQRWLCNHQEARLILELPLRERYAEDREMLRHLLFEAGLEAVEQGTETGYDDWQGSDGLPAEVECWWSVWRRC